MKSLHWRLQKMFFPQKNTVFAIYIGLTFLEVGPDKTSYVYQDFTYGFLRWWVRTEWRNQGSALPDQIIMLHMAGRLGMIWIAHSRSLSEPDWWMHGRGVGQTAGRAVRPSSTCLEAARAKQHARHITATFSSHMFSRSLQTFVHHNNASPKISKLALTKTFVF